MRSGAAYRQCFDWLEIDHRRLDEIQRQPSVDIARGKLKLLQVDVKRAWRRRALAWHPDHNGGNEELTERFKVLSEFVERLAKVTIQVRRKPLWVTYSPNTTITTNMTSATTVTFDGVVADILTNHFF